MLQPYFSPPVQGGQFCVFHSSFFSELLPLEAVLSRAGFRSILQDFLMRGSGVYTLFLGLTTKRVRAMYKNAGRNRAAPLHPFHILSGSFGLRHELGLLGFPRVLSRNCRCIPYVIASSKELGLRHTMKTRLRIDYDREIPSST